MNQPVKFVKDTNLKNPSYWIGTDDRLNSVVTDYSALPPTFLYEGDIESPSLFNNTAPMNYQGAQGSCLQDDWYKPKVLNPRVGEDYLTPDLLPWTPIPARLDLQLRGLREYLKS